jgi:Zn finger protein HypA/HybF involved in hydrogenase expression
LHGGVDRWLALDEEPMNEAFECRNCFHIGSLDSHLRCERCGSDSVIPQQVFRGDTFSHLEELVVRALARN